LYTLHLSYIQFFLSLSPKIITMLNNLLQGKRGIITGALDENSIAWKVAEKAHAQGAKIVLTNAPIALRMGKINELAAKTNSKVIPADATNVEEINKMLAESQEFLGGKIDFVLHSIAQSPNIRKNVGYPELNYDYYNKTLDISAISLHKMLSCAYKMDALNEWASVVALSYIAAQRTFSFYTDMADAKAMLESIVRSFGYHYGKHRKVRVNSVSQSPTKTTAGAGIKGFETFYDFAELNSPLGNASSETCADYCISLFSDLSKMVTMQNLFHDGGYSNTGASADMMEKFGG
jgi:enoyl-[acyl-carrier protein] reductase I